MHVLRTGWPQRLAGASLLVLANKQDLPGSLSMPEIAQVLGLADLEGTRHWQIQACSAVTGGGLVDGIGWIVGDVASRIFVLD